MPRPTYTPRGQTPQTPPPPPAGGSGTGTTPQLDGLNYVAGYMRNNPIRQGYGTRQGYGPRSGSQMNRPVFNIIPQQPQTPQTKTGGGNDGGNQGDNQGGNGTDRMPAPFWKRPAALYFLGALILLPLLFKKIK